MDISERDGTHRIKGINPKEYNILEYFKKNSIGWHSRTDILKGIGEILLEDKVPFFQIQLRTGKLFSPNEFNKWAKELKRMGFLKKKGSQKGTVWALNNEKLMNFAFEYHKTMKQVQAIKDFEDGKKKTEKISEGKE